MCFRNAPVKTLLPPLQRMLAHRTCNFFFTSCTHRLGAQIVGRTEIKFSLPVLVTNSKMMKIEPLSRLSTNKETEDGDPNAETKTKRTILPKELLESVTRSVRTQFEQDEFVSVEPEDFVYPSKPEKERKDASHNAEDVFDISVLFSETFGRFDRAHKKSVKKASKKVGRKRKKDPLQEDNSEKGGAGETEKKKQKKMMPNYFVAIQITNPQIHDGLRAVQQSVVSQKPTLSAAMIPLPTLHLTMLVMHLADEEEIERAKATLTVCGNKLNMTHKAPTHIQVSGLDHFGNSVVFAKVAPDENLQVLQRIVDVVLETFKENNTDLTGEKGFKPHITIMKLSRAPRLRKAGVKKIDSKFYSDFAGADFGTQAVESLQLCSMLHRKDENGYYRVLHSVPLCEGVSAKSVFTVKMEKEIQWSYAEGPATEPIQPSAEELAKLKEVVAKRQKSRTMVTTSKLSRTKFSLPKETKR